MPQTSVVHTLPASERLERLVVAASSLITEVSLEGVLQRVVEVAAEVIGARYAAIGVLGPDGRLLENFTTYGIDPEQRAPAPRRLGVCGQHLAQGQGALRMPRLSSPSGVLGGAVLLLNRWRQPPSRCTRGPG